MRPEVAVAFPFTAPIIVNRPGGWESTIPQWLRELAVEQRLIMMMKDHEGLATWADVAMYLYTVNLEGPIDHEHSMIYFHASLICLEATGRDVPDGFEDARELTGYTEHVCRDLRAKIFNKQLRSVMDAFKAWKREHKNDPGPIQLNNQVGQNTLEKWVVMSKEEEQIDPLLKALMAVAQ